MQPHKTAKSNTSLNQGNQFLLPSCSHVSQVESISLDPLKRIHTALCHCGCHAAKTKLSLGAILQPFIPSSDHIPEYYPKNGHIYGKKPEGFSRIVTLKPLPPHFPKSLHIKARGSPGILAYLTNTIDQLKSNKIPEQKTISPSEFKKVPSISC